MKILEKILDDFLKLCRFCSVCFFLGFFAMVGFVCAGQLLGVTVAIGYTHDNERAD